MRSKGAVLYYIFPSCVRCCISSNIARSFRTKIQRRLKTIGLQIVIQLLKNYSSLAVNYRTNFVESFNFVHILEIYYDLIKNRYASSDQPSITPLRNNSQPAIIAILKYFRDLLSVVRAKKKLGVAFIQSSEAKIMSFKSSCIINYWISWKNGPKVVNICVLKNSIIFSFEIMLPVSEA